MYKLSRFKEIESVMMPTNGSKEYQSDIALIELKSPFKWSDSVKPACLPTTEFVSKYEGLLMVSLRWF